MNHLNSSISFNEYFLNNKYDISKIVEILVLFSIEYKRAMKSKKLLSFPDIFT